MKWCVVIRTSEETVGTWIGGLTEGMAEATASLLRAWMPRSIFGAWAEPDWESAEAAPARTLATDASVNKEKVAA
jgi:hypothetical protein